MDQIIINQYKLFNNILEENIKDKLIKDKILVYENINKFNINDTINKYDLDKIEWYYDENNNRIPYIENNIKINIIKLNKNDNIYDYISSASIIDNNDEIICGENFLSLADCFIGTKNSLNANPNTHKFSKLNIDIESINDSDERFINFKKIFVKTDDIGKFYNKFKNNLEDKIIITHNSDYSIDTTFKENINKVKKQYSQNCLFRNEKLEPIPIGIENRMWFDHNIIHNIRKRTDIKKTKNIYFLFSLQTHPSRITCYNILKDKLEWNSKLSKEEYFIELKKHKYAICPRGNGLDTHRLWECFYLDVIPIMLKEDSVNIDNLPIIYLEKWSDLDISNLDNLIQFTDIKLSKITMSYYNKNIIMNNNYQIIILIIASDNTDYYIAMQKIWNLYMNKHPHIKSFFIKENINIDNNLLIDENSNTINVKCEPSLIPGVLIKTIESLKYIYNNYNFKYIFRTNLSSLIDLNKLYLFILNNSFDYSAVIGNYNKIQFGSGAGFFLSRECVNYLINIDNINYSKYNDDVIIGEILTNKFPIFSLSRIDILDFNKKKISNNELKSSNIFHFRCKNNNQDITVNNLEKMYELIYTNE